MTRSPGETDALGLLGLARRAGAVISGVEATRKALRGGEVRLVLLSVDGSPAQLDRVRVLAGHRKVPVAWISEQEELGRVLGKGPLSAVGVTGSSFAKQLLQLLPPGGSRPAREGGHVGRTGGTQ